ncbi:MAG: histidine--tRNA ligase [Bacteroidetes bacterium]|nr:histidine--tRNA ligase [Bacteroidota bacterium]
MAINKPSIPKGTRDFSPEEMVRRNYIFDTIRAVFKKYGYQPIETPAMENIETLTGKYGDEGDQLLFKILNSRPFEAKDSDKEKMRAAFERTLSQNTNSADLTERALRYDLTVPFARYVVQHQNEITFPFKRYQIQPVWRADRPQKGRYREFFQCDADVIGSNSLINEVEIVQMIDEVFTELKVPVLIKINNRKILSGIAEFIGEKEKIVDITVAIDKLDKIGVDGVNKELREKQISESAIEKLQPLIVFKGDYQAKIELLSKMLSSSEVGMKGIEEIKFIFETYNALSPITNHQSPTTLELDITLARGLNYYTGAIFEVKANVGTLTSSITGGGRYDDLTGVFGLPNLSGVGISFGADRIYDVLNELNLYPESVTAGTRLLFINKGGKSESISLSLLKKVREQNIAAEIYPDNVKWEKQAKYVDAKKIPFTATVEEDGKITLKCKENGKWNTLNVSLEELISTIK